MRQQLEDTINHNQITKMAVQELAEEDDIKAAQLAETIKEDIQVPKHRMLFSTVNGEN